MKFSICISLYNRIEFLLMSLDRISRQTWNDIEICISDDCSIDDTEAQIIKLKETYRYPIVYSRNDISSLMVILRTKQKS